MSGLWISPTEFRRFNKASLSNEIASRGRSLDFSALSGFLPNPDPVLKAQGRDIQVYRELRHDAHVGGCIRRRKAAVAALEWGIEGGSARARKVVDGMLRGIDFDRLLREILDAVLYGYQPIEVMWQRQEGLLLPADLIGKPAEWFVFGPENDLRFRSREHMLNGEELPPKKFLLPRQDASYANPYGFPDLSMVFWPTVFKKGGLKFWVNFCEKFGTPWLIGKQPRGTPDHDADALLDQLEAMVQDAVAVVPDDSSVDIIEAAGKSASSDLYERLLMFCRAEVSTALLGQNQTTEKDSTHASAKSGIEVTREIRDGDKRIVEQAINTLIGWICDLNFANVERPTYRMWEQEEVDTVQAERDATLTSAGVKLTRAYFKRAYRLEEGDLAPEAALLPNDAPKPTASFAETNTILDQRERSASDQDELEAGAAQLASQYQALIGPRLDSLLTLLEETQDLALFRERLAELLADSATAPVADAVQRARINAAMLGALHGQRQ